VLASRQDGFHGVGESHGRTVGFIQHHGANAIELQRATLQVIDGGRAYRRLPAVRA
jgi:hypothetical protein